MTPTPSSESGEAPEAALSVVVLSFRHRPSVVAAVRSLVEQDTPCELVVVHSGGESPAPTLDGAGLDVRVISSPAPLRPGGARNLGIASTSGRAVAFLADDCTAAPGWVRERLAAHRAGVPAVASALLCLHPERPIELAAHLALFVRRMPGIDPNLALAYGASYDRRLFARYGLFREDLEGGEDTEFHQRLADADKPRWNPAIRTVHTGPETLPEYLAAQYRRGRRIAHAWRAIEGAGRLEIARDAIARTRFAARHATRLVAPDARRAALFAIPLIALGNLVYAAGALTASPSSKSP